MEAGRALATGRYWERSPEFILGDSEQWVFWSMIYVRLPGRVW